MAYPDLTHMEDDMVLKVVVKKRAKKIIGRDHLGRLYMVSNGVVQFIS